MLDSQAERASGWIHTVSMRGSRRGESQSAYRSELAGLYVMATMIRTLCKFYQITEGEVELVCDGLQASRHVSRMEVTTEAKAPQFDLLAATRCVCQKCPVTLKFRHVKGHQDDNFFADLDEWASLNMDMDDGVRNTGSEVKIFAHNNSTSLESHGLFGWQGRT